MHYTNLKVNLDENFSEDRILNESLDCPYARNWSSLSNHILEERGLRIGDSVVIYPMQGRRKNIKLNRTIYHIDSFYDHNCLVEEVDIKLPAVVGHRFSFSLLLCSKNRDQDLDNNSRYLLKSKTDVPFRINGTYSYEAFIERNDRVDIGYNQIRFYQRPLQQEKADTQDDLINQNIVQSDLCVLLEGETGTGKSRLAQQIHVQSGRLGQFVNINIASFSNNLIESELFGHVKGAFTGAIRRKSGAFFQAHRGTLFLDEIDSLPIELQSKLLLFLDSKEIRPVGSDEVEKTDVRLIFASGRKLKKQVEKKEMRKDFYYRISSGAVLSLPSLRKSPAMIDRLCDQICLDKDIHISRELNDFYKTLSWPGNIRQFLGHLNKKIVMAKGRKLELEKEDKELLMQNFEGNFLESERSFMSIDQVKTIYAYKTFLHFGNDMKECAKALDITVSTLKSFLKRAEHYIATTSEI